MSLAEHHDRVRGILAGRVKSPYGELLRAQQLQVLRHMFARAREAMGTTSFDALLDRFRVEVPPRDPNPARWARHFADWLEAQEGIAPRVLDLAIYAAMRVEAEIAPHDDGPPLRRADVAVFTTDPRTSVPTPGPPLALVVFRDREDRVRTEPLDEHSARALGIARGELALDSTSPEELARGQRTLERLGLVP